MKKMLFTILTIGTMVPAAASAQDVPLGTPVDTAHMSVRGVAPATRERILELRQRAVQERARTLEPRLRALQRSVEPRVRVLERSVQPRLQETQRQLLVERARRAEQVQRLAPMQERLRESVRAQGSAAREVEGFRATPALALCERICCTARCR